jgi:hypothetical protein
LVQKWDQGKLSTLDFYNFIKRWPQKRRCYVRDGQPAAQALATGQKREYF